MSAAVCGAVLAVSDSMLTIGEVAKLCDCHRDEINRALQSRRLRYRRIDDRRLVKLADAIAFRKLLWAAPRL
jgi:chromosome segregation and condensation protein ScpB